MNNVIEVKGKYNSAKIFTDDVEQEAISQIINMCNMNYTAGNKIRIMPDTHAGAGCTIGTTMEVTNAVVANFVGVDIGCGMAFVKLPVTVSQIDMKELDRIIHEYVPSGLGNINSGLSKHISQSKLSMLLSGLHCTKNINVEYAMQSCGSLGGGNHFIEIDYCVEDNSAYLVVHSGSRHLGVEVAKYYQKVAAESAKRMSTEEKSTMEMLVRNMTAEGKTKEIASALAAYKKECEEKHKFPTGMEPLLNEDMQNYLHDEDICVEYATMSRNAMIQTIWEKMGWKGVPNIQCTRHNYIEVFHNGDAGLSGMLRKGAISAKEGEVVLIPLNMRDGSLLCVGKGNPDWNYSAPHGAGRLMSRSKAKATVNMDEYKNSMKNVYTTSVTSSTIDEAPMVYKPAEEIEKYIQDTVSVIGHLKPVYNFKAGD